MNKQKIIKYILIAIPLLFLAKCGVESTIYSANKIPEINPNPMHKMRVHGKFPFEDANLSFTIGYVNNNQKCDDTNWLAGTRFPQKREATFPAKIKNGIFESTIFLDYYLPGLCKYDASYMGFSYRNKLANRFKEMNFIKLVNKEIPQHAISVYCSSEINNGNIKCKLQKDEHFIERVPRDDSLKLYYFLFNHNEVSDSHQEIKINFIFEGEK